MKTISQQTIKGNNLKAIYNLIFKYDGISRAQLAHNRKLSKTTISTLVEELISRGFIYDSGAEDSGNIGRKPNRLHLKRNTNYAVCIAWEAEYVKAYLIDIAGKIVSEVIKTNFEKENQYVALSQECFQEILNSREINLLFVCVIIPGMLDQRDRSFYTTKLYIKEEEQDQILEELKNAFDDYPVAVFNDTACYAYAEKIYGSVNQEDFAVFNFANGIGVTFFIGNHMIGRAGGAYTQVGQLLIPATGENEKHFLEENIGEGALKRRIERMQEQSVLMNLKKVTYAELSDAAGKGDAAAKKLLESISEEFSHALSSVITIVGVKLVILGGKSKSLGEEFLQNVSENIKQYGFSRMVEGLEIRYSTLSPEAYLFGAVKYYMDEYFDFNKDNSGEFYIG